MGRIGKIYRLPASVALLLMSNLLGCQKKGEWFGPIDPDPVIDTTQTSSNAVTYLVGCEGNFQYGNASLSAYFPDETRVENRAFERANGFQPGDVLQSMVQVDSMIYVVMNNSGLIRVIDAHDFQELQVIEGLNSPRYALPVGKHSIWVTSFGGASISIVDRSSGAVTHSVPMALWTEQLCQLDNAVYAMNKTDSSLVVIDTASKQSNGAYPLGGDPIELGVWDNGVHVAVQRKEVVRVVRITTGAYSMIMEYKGVASDVAFDDSGIHVLTADSILHFDWSGNMIRSIEHDLQTPYSIHADSTLVMVTDVRDYLSNGVLSVFDAELSPIEAHTTGVIPQAIMRIQQP